MEEKRKLKRRYLLAEVELKTGDGSSMSAVLMNISSGGIGLYTAEPVSKKEKVKIKITYLENRKLREVEEIPGVVRWVQAIGSHHAAGIMFTEKVSKATFPILTRCLDYAKRNK